MKRITILIILSLTVMCLCSCSPKKADIATVKSKYSEAEGAKFEFNGIILFPGKEPLFEINSKDSGKPYSWFFFRDKSDSDYIWYDIIDFPSPPKGGDNITLTVENSPASIHGVPFGGISRFFLFAKKITRHFNIMDSPKHIQEYFFDSPLSGPPETASVRFFNLRECSFSETGFSYAYDRFYGELDTSIYTPKRIESQSFQFTDTGGNTIRIERSNIREIRLIPRFNNSGPTLEKIESVEIFLKDGSTHKISPSGNFLLNPTLTGLVDPEEEQKIRIREFGLFGRSESPDCRNFTDVNFNQLPEIPENRIILPARIIFN